MGLDNPDRIDRKRRKVGLPRRNSVTHMFDVRSIAIFIVAVHAFMG